MQSIVGWRCNIPYWLKQNPLLVGNATHMLVGNETPRSPSTVSVEDLPLIGSFAQTRLFLFITPLLKNSRKGGLSGNRVGNKVHLSSGGPSTLSENLIDL
jgi:hypothetical protein